MSPQKLEYEERKLKIIEIKNDVIAVLMDSITFDQLIWCIGCCPCVLVTNQPINDQTVDINRVTNLGVKSRTAFQFICKQSNSIVRRQ